MVIIQRFFKIDLTLISFPEAFVSIRNNEAELGIPGLAEDAVSRYRSAEGMSSLWR